MSSHKQFLNTYSYGVQDAYILLIDDITSIFDQPFWSRKVTNTNMPCAKLVK